jgi:hypothetical protein
VDGKKWQADADVSGGWYGCDVARATSQVSSPKFGTWELALETWDLGLDSSTLEFDCNHTNTFLKCKTVVFLVLNEKHQDFEGS